MRRALVLGLVLAASPALAQQPPAPPAAPASEVVLPVAVPKGVLGLSWARPGGGSPIGDTVQQSEPGSTCAPQRIALKEKHNFGRPYELKMRVDHAMPIAPNFVSFSRPAPAGD